MALTTRKIQEAYIAFFNRPADVSGLEGWLQYKGDDADLLATFAQSTEYTDLFTGKTPEQVVTTVYHNLFARAPDTDGLQNWVNNLKAGAISIGNIAYVMLNSAGPGDIDAVAAKLAVAETFTDYLTRHPSSRDGYETGGSNAGAIVREWFSQIGESGAGKQETLDAIADAGDKLAALPSNSAKYILAIFSDIYDDGQYVARWNFPEVLGESANEPFTAGIGHGVALTYSFLSSVPNYYEGEIKSIATFSEAQKAATVEALARIAQVTNITFAPAKPGQIGQLTFANSPQAPLQAGFAFFPSYETSVSGGVFTKIKEQGPGGDVWLNNMANWSSKSWEPGGDGFWTLLHEIGHALGLKHPHDPNNDGAVLNTGQDDDRHTVMSYQHANNLSPGTLMPLDIEALQYLYGANTATRAGNDVYKWDTNAVIPQTIWDAGGVDAIDASNQAKSTINLNTGEYSAIGATSSYRNLTIAKNVVIENAKGGNGDDTLTGNAVDNRLEGGLGDDCYTGYRIGRITGHDTIKDTGGNDIIELANVNINLDSVKISHRGNNLVVTLSADSDITIADFYIDHGAIETLEGIGWTVDLVGVASQLANGAFTTLGDILW